MVASELQLSTLASKTQSEHDSSVDELFQIINRIQHFRCLKPRYDLPISLQNYRAYGRNLRLCEGVRRCDEHMIALDAVDTATSRVDVDTKLKRLSLHRKANHQRRIERSLATFVRNELDCPEETATADIAYVRPLCEICLQALLEQLTHVCAPLHEEFVLDDHLYSQCNSARGRMGLLRVSMIEAPCALTTRFDDILMDQNACDGRVASSETFAYRHDIWRCVNISLLPRHQNGQCPVLPTHGFHRCKISRCRCDASAGRSADGHGEKGDDAVGIDAHELVVQLFSKTLNILRVRFSGVLILVGVAGTNMGDVR